MPAFSQEAGRSEASVQAFGSWVKSTTDNGVQQGATNSGGVLGDLLGREGNHLLVNGRKQPTLTFREGALQRWRLVNASKSR